MNFDPREWTVIDCDGSECTVQSRVHVVSAYDTALYVQCDGVIALASVGRVHKLTVPAGAMISLKVVDPDSDDNQAYLHDAMQLAVQATGEIFTNLDRRPHESGHVMAVRQAARRAQIEMASEMREFRRERARFMADQKALSERVPTSPGDRKDLGEGRPGGEPPAASDKPGEGDAGDGKGDPAEEDKSAKPASTK